MDKQINCIFILSELCAKIADPVSILRITGHILVHLGAYRQ